MRTGWKRDTDRRAKRSAFGSIARHVGDAPHEAMWLDESTALVLDQGQTESCVAHAATMCIHLDNHGPLASRLVAYATARMIGGESRTTLVDDGCVPADMVAVLGQYGICLESDWPFDASNVNVPPPWDVLQTASAYRITAWERLADDSQRTAQIRSMLAAKTPVMFGMLVGSAYQSLSGPGAECKAVDPSGTGHMQLLCGYSGTRFRVLNSWSRTWGDSGFAWIDESVLLDPSTSDVYALSTAPQVIT